ncbi:hypothetical protein [Archangium sp.]|jgi:hypothetical protein|uniref:hypothetical protein n=1 Tax=Archangium sp. TaxID=1872627 RepID=UPI002ED853DA
MFIRLISCGALVLGAALLGTGCAPTAEAQQSSALEEPQKKKPKDTFCGGFAAIQCPEGYIFCEPGQVPFSDECGCGCEPER